MSIVAAALRSNFLIGLPLFPGHFNLDDFKSGRAQYASDLQPRIFISRLDSVQNR